jgi:hypothetical protein
MFTSVFTSVFTSMILALSMLATGMAYAAVPDAAHSTCPGTVTVSSGGTVCFDVTVHDAGNNPVTGSTVIVNFGSCGVTFCPTQPHTGSSVFAVTNAQGVAHYCICATLSAPCTSAITADGIPLCSNVSTVETCGSQVPSTMSYQGVLSDNAGGIPPEGPHAFTFRIYDDATLSGAHLLWTENHNLPVARGGGFSAMLGAGSPAVALSLPFDRPYYLGVSVDGGAELAPRTALASTPYSMTARTVADCGVTSNSIATGQVVKSLNGLRDGVTLAAGSNVSITPSGQTLTISASTPSSAGAIRAWGLVKVSTAGVITLIAGSNVATITNGGTFLDIIFTNSIGTPNYAVLVQDGRPSVGGFPALITYSPDFFDGQRDPGFFLLRSDSISNWGAPPRNITFSFTVIAN